MHQANGVQRCLETQRRCVRSPVGWREKEGLNAWTEAGDTEHLRILHKHDCMPQKHCSAGCRALTWGEQPRTQSSMVELSRTWAAASMYPCSYISHPSAPLLFGSSREWYVAAGQAQPGKPSHQYLGNRTHFSTWSAAPFAVRHQPVTEHGNKVRNSHTSNAVSVSCHCWQFNEGSVGLFDLKANHDPNFAGPP